MYEKASDSFRLAKEFKMMINNLEKVKKKGVKLEIL